MPRFQYTVFLCFLTCPLYEIHPDMCKINWWFWSTTGTPGIGILNNRNIIYMTYIWSVDLVLLISMYYWLNELTKTYFNKILPCFAIGHYIVASPITATHMSLGSTIKARLSILPKDTNTLAQVALEFTTFRLWVLLCFADHMRSPMIHETV